MTLFELFGLSKTQDANTPAHALKRAIPVNMSAPATNLPSNVVGYRSPYPTVVIVVKDHQRALSREFMDATKDVDSASRIAKAPIAQVNGTKIEAQNKVVTLRLLETTLKARNANKNLKALSSRIKGSSRASNSIQFFLK